MYERILVPLDGSEASEEALGIVRELASQRIRLLRVESNDPLLIPPSVSGVEPGWKERFTERVRGELEVVAERLRNEGLAVEVEVRSGDAAEEIIASAADADLVVMSTHGRGAAGRLIFGSTADRVARHGTTPTMLIRRGASDDGPVTPSRVVVPLDGSELAEQALPEAEKLAGTLGLPIHLVRAVSADDVLATVRGHGAVAGAGLSQQDDAYEQARLETEGRAADYLEDQANGLRDAGLPADVELLKGTPAFVLLWMVQPTDVVVMTTHGRGGYRRWVIGSVAEKLVREAAGPILLVRGGAGSERETTTGNTASA